jgi:hypothetical protein
MIKHILTTLLVLISVSCAIAQPGSWGTKNKKAIKYVEEALAATRELDQRTGRPNYKGAIE